MFVDEAVCVGRLVVSCCVIRLRVVCDYRPESSARVCVFRIHAVFGYVYVGSGNGGGAVYVTIGGAGTTIDTNVTLARCDFLANTGAYGEALCAHAMHICSL